MTLVSKKGHQPDFSLIVVVLLLVLIGLAALISASSEQGKARFGDPFYFFKHQIWSGLLPGMAGFLAAYFINYQNYRRFALWFLLGNIVLLCLVFVPGIGIVAGGARRWISLGGLSFQPSELLKITLVMFLAAWLSNLKMNRSGRIWGGLLPFLMICGLIAGLLFLQPATSMVFILMAAGMAMYFLSNPPWRHIFLGVLVGAVGFVGVIYLSGYGYRLQRLVTFINPEADIQSSGYQVNQAKIAIGSGGLWGTGYGRSTNKVRTIPAPMDDSVFAVVAQELGFIGSSSLVFLFAFLVVRMFVLARKVRDRFGFLVLCGFAVILGIQSFVNMASISGLIPLTGVPLPFVSYGGTALAVFLTMSGIAVNISKYSGHG